MNKIAVISVYYGILPPYYRLWLRSCEYNPTIDFYLVTDIPLHNLPKNVRIIPLAMNELHALVENKLGLKVCMDKPYKICDYKPMFGQIFEDYLRGYDYWGHCDMDMIFGDLQFFLDKYHLENYERFLYLGHLSFYHNTEESNKNYRLDGSLCGDWKQVVTSPQNYAFDESSGIYSIYKKHHIAIFDKRIFADIGTIHSRFCLALQDKNYKNQVFYWENGHVYRAYYENHVMQKDEFIYIHFQKRNLTKEPFDGSKATAFFIGPKGFAKKINKVTLQDIRRWNPYPGIVYSQWEEWKRTWKKTMLRVKRKCKLG